MKKTISILLALVLLLSSITYTKVEASGNEYPNKNSWYEASGLQEFFLEKLYNAEVKQGTIAISTNGKPFPMYIMKNGSKYYLNYRIFKQKNLYAYGNYASVADNYFKCGYQIHEDLTQLQPSLYYGNGYFLKPNNSTCRGDSQNPDKHTSSCKKHSNGTIRGEWKYLGFDISGNKFSNMWMINVATETKFTERNWQVEPWKEPLKSKTGLTAGASEYNTIAYGSERISKSVSNGVSKWISSTFDKMPGYKGIPTKNAEYPSGYSFDAYKFMYVQSPPTLFQSGSGRMWHLSRNNVLWYQTFSIPKLQKKEYLPVDCTIVKTSMPTKLPSANGADNRSVTLEFEVSGILRDDVQEETGKAPEGWTPYYKDAGGRTTKYTRYDLASWDFTLSIQSLGIQDAKPLEAVRHPNKQTNTAKTTIQGKTTIGKLKGLPKDSNGKYILAVTATAKPTYTNKTKNGLGNGSNRFTLDELPSPPQTTIDIPTIKINNHIGEIAFDGIQFSDVSDSTDMSTVKSTELYINGEQVDHNQFFSGSYIFPSTSDKNGYFAEITCIYNLDKSKIVLEGLTDEQKEKIMSDTPLKYVSTDYVYVYPTKPVAQFKLSSNSWKQNRILNVENNSTNGNIQLVIDKYPIVEYRWSYGGDTSQLNKGTDTDLKKQLQYKEPGAYSLTLECRNTLGKWSDPYTMEFRILEDASPDIELNLSDSVVTRNDEISAWHYEVNSTDGDKIASAKIELWYDSDNNGSVDTLIQEWNGLSDFPKYSPTQLGYYKFFVYAQDEFVGVNGQETLSQFITDSDKKSASLECDFWVDNYQPLSDIYIDAPIERPNVDLYIMRDKELPQDKYEYLASNRVTMENALLGRNIIPNVNIWDMKTYEYSTPASTSSNTGTNYPSGEIPYTSAGYSGKLQRTSVTDNGGYHDFGHYESRTETKTISFGGGYSSGHGYGGSTPSSSISYSDGEGYTGSMSIQNYVYTSTPCGHSRSPAHGEGYFNWTRSWSGYSGTASRTVSYWVPNMQWISSYTGYYSGTIYKYVRQPYTDTWRGNSSKYILYVSDGDISEISDFISAVAKTDAKVILAGTTTIQKQYLDCAKFINTKDKTVQEILNETLEYISAETPAIQHRYILRNQQFTLNVGEDDLEKDEIVSREMQYVHDKDYFDNPTGPEAGTQAVFKADTGWTTEIKNSFSNVGKYQIYRRVKDKPSGAYGDNYSYYSGATEVDIYVHRKPIAKAALDWDFDGATNTYRTNWKDLSFDLDHNITRAKTDKGISDRKIMWKKEGGEWSYTIPENLSPGTYRIRYYVKDIENTWSDVFTMDINGTIFTDVPEIIFTLKDTPPMQFEAELRALKTTFRNPASPISLPAGEDLEVFNLWTRYPSNPYLTMALYNLSGTRLSGIKTVSYSTGTGNKSGNDISWNNIPYNVPNTLIDGNYIFKITANAEQNKTITFPVTVKTPINLKGYINGRETTAHINTGDTAQFKFTTSQYVSKTQLNFEGQTYTSDAGKIKLISNTGMVKTWELRLDIADGAYPDGRQGRAEFKAWLPSGISEIVYVDYKFLGVRAYSFEVTMMLDPGWRTYYFDTYKGIDDNRDGKIDRYPRRNNTDIPAEKMPINYYSLVGHSRRYIKAGYKVKGRIDIQGEPDYAAFSIHYNIKGSTRTDAVKLTRTSGNTYTFEWIIPLETDDNTFVSFDLITKKGASVYGSEKWIDSWDSRNTSRQVFYVKGKATDDLNYVQSQ